jgi:hypothetical protein
MGGIVLRACFFRQGISRRKVAASKVCVVQTPARTALRSSPSREQQFWCDSLLLGQDSRYLSKAKCRCMNQTPLTRLRFSIASQFEFCLSSQIASALTESFLCRFDVSRRQQANRRAKRLKLTRPMMRRCTSLDAKQAQQSFWFDRQCDDQLQLPQSHALDKRGERHYALPARECHGNGCC